MSSKNGMSKIRKPLALAAAATVAISMAAVAAPAQAADQTVNDVTLTWGLNLESGAGAFQPGACNFLSAGKAGNSGSSRAWTQEDGFYKAADGNVSILKDGPNSSSIAPTWDTKCQTGAGTAVSPVGTANVSNNKV
ncbi:MAG: cell surface protein, partial [Glutamicibacter protophormiae]